MEKRIQRRFYLVLACCMVFCVCAIIAVSAYRGDKEWLSVTMFVAGVFLLLAVGNMAVLFRLLAQRRAIKKTK